MVERRPKEKPGITVLKIFLVSCSWLCPGPLTLARHALKSPCFSVDSQASLKGEAMALEGRCVSSKAHQGSETDEGVAGRNGREVFPRQGVQIFSHYLALATPCFWQVSTYIIVGCPWNLPYEPVFITPSLFRSRRLIILKSLSALDNWNSAHFSLLLLKKFTNLYQHSSNLSHVSHISRHHFTLLGGHFLYFSQYWKIPKWFG